MDILQIQSVTHTCIMHSEIHAAKPGKCPKCGMKLNKKKAKLVNKSVQNMFTIAFRNLKYAPLLLKAVR